MRLKSIICLYSLIREVLYHIDLEEIISPVNAEVLQNLLVESDYNKDETRFLVEGFKKGFDIGYEGPTNRCDLSRNIPFEVGVGDKQDMWSKIMKDFPSFLYL